MSRGGYPARWWHIEGERIQCDLCPRLCKMKPGQKGFCYVRESDGEKLILNTYGLSSGFAMDPIEKKPLYHFHPGSDILSFGTVGCNLGCKFCQNWDLSKATSDSRHQVEAPPEAIAATASSKGSPSVAYTYNDPIIYAEYAIDTARECRKAGINNVAVTNGYISEVAREEFFSLMDGVNIDLKAFTDGFYRKYTSGKLQPVLDTLDYLVNKSEAWVEITTLVIPGLNDSDSEIDSMTKWIFDHLGPNVPYHLSAFHPTYKMAELPFTPEKSLKKSREIAMSNGLKFVYTGNISDKVGGSTWCPDCGEIVIERDRYRLGTLNLEDGRCAHCKTEIAGRFK